SLTLAVIEHRSAKRGNGAGIGEQCLHLGASEARKLGEKFPPPVADCVCQVAFVVGKIEEWGRGTEFLPLEQHRYPWHQQKIRGHRPHAPRACQRMAALATARVSDLIVVLQEDDEAFGRKVEAGRAAGL